MTCAFCGSALPAGAMFCGECGRGVNERPAQAVEPEPAAMPQPVREPVPEPVPEPEREPAREPRPEPGPEPAPSPPAERFILQFSTGESVQVFATGLIGRNPRPEPGEVVDELVTILDPGKSVSKTHLEFGQEDGVFWVCDRFSGNGTVLREPDADARRCEPGRRYRVARGGRVDLGDQFMIVS